MNSRENVIRLIDGLVREYEKQSVQAIIDARELSVLMTKTFDALLEERETYSKEPTTDKEVEDAKAWIATEMEKGREALRNLTKVRVMDIVAKGTAEPEIVELSKQVFVPPKGYEFDFESAELKPKRRYNVPPAGTATPRSK